jgi:hypothetical protein
MWSNEDASFSFAGLQASKPGAEQRASVIPFPRRKEATGRALDSLPASASDISSNPAARWRWLGISICLALCLPVLMFSFFLFGLVLLPLLPLLGVTLVVSLGGSPSAPPGRPHLPSAGAAAAAAAVEAQAA